MRGPIREDGPFILSSSNLIKPIRRHSTFQLHKKRSIRQLGVLENLYSGTFKRFAAPLPSILRRSPSVTSYVTHKTYPKTAL